MLHVLIINSTYPDSRVVEISTNIPWQVGSEVAFVLVGKESRKVGDATVEQQTFRIAVFVATDGKEHFAFEFQMALIADFFATFKDDSITSMFKVYFKNYFKRSRLSI